MSVVFIVAFSQALPLHNLDFIGMTALTDPPKDGVPEAINKCREAGIRVFMVSPSSRSLKRTHTQSVCTDNAVINTSPHA